MPQGWMLKNTKITKISCGEECWPGYKTGLNPETSVASSH